MYSVSRVQIHQHLRRSLALRGSGVKTTGMGIENIMDSCQIWMLIEVSGFEIFILRVFQVVVGFGHRRALVRSVPTRRCMENTKIECAGAPEGRSRQDRPPTAAKTKRPSVKIRKIWNPKSKDLPTLKDCRTLGDSRFLSDSGDSKTYMDIYPIWIL